MFKSWLLVKILFILRLRWIILLNLGMSFILRFGDNLVVFGLIFICYLLVRCCFIFILGDDILKIWDLRNFKEYFNVVMNLINYYL